MQKQGQGMQKQGQGMLTAAEAGSKVGPYGGQAMQRLHDVIQGRCSIAVQLPLGL